MSSEPAEPLEEPPWPEDAEGVDLARPWEPARPLTQKDLDYYGNLPWELRTYNPWACMFNLAAEDGIGYMIGIRKRQCEVLLADPTKSRYCIEHARELGVDYYAPSELSEATDKETAVNLTRLVPKAVHTLEQVMNDDEAPHGVRAKAADSVLDRTGYAKGVDVRVDARVATVDITGLIKDRLDALKDSMVIPEVDGAGVVTVAGAILDDHGDGDDAGGPDGGVRPGDGDPDRSDRDPTDDGAA